MDNDENEGDEYEVDSYPGEGDIIDVVDDNDNYDEEGDEPEVNSYPEFGYIEDPNLDQVEFSDDEDNLETISGIRYNFNGPKFSSDSESNEENSSDAEEN